MLLTKWVHEYRRSRSLRFNISNFFSWETARPIDAKFHMEIQWDGGMKLYSNSPSHMTKMAAMLIFGKNMKNSSSPEP